HAEWRATLTAVANLWTTGIDIDWDRIHTTGQPRPVAEDMTLPTYAFQRKRFYIAPGGKTTNQQDIPNQDDSRQTPSTMHQPTVENTTVSRIPNIVTSIEEVFENTSGFELGDFDSDTTFFEMGLDSLVLTQTATALEREFGVEVTFRQLLEQTCSVNQLAGWLDQQLPAEKYLPTATVCKETSATPQDAFQNPAQPPVDFQTNANATAPVSSPSATTVPNAIASPTQVEATVAQSTVPPQPLPSAGTVGASDATNLAQLQLQAQLQLMQQQMNWLSGGQLPAESGSPVLSATPNNAVQSTQQTVAATNVEAFPNNPGEPVTPQQSASLTQAPADPQPPELKFETSDTSNSGVEGSDVELAPQGKRFKTVKLNDGALDAEQQMVLDEMIRINDATLAKSKSYAQAHREYLADPRTVSGFRPNLKEMTHPIVVDRSQGVHLWDLDGNQYIDFTCGFGSNLLGHAHPITIEAVTRQVQQDYSIGPQSPLAGEVAKLFCELTDSERMAFSNTGSEAVLGCTRLARNYTGRDLIVMFNGDYHGILDEVIARGSKKLKSFPAATGIPKEHVENTLILDYGSDESLEIIAQNIDRLAAVLVEPVQSRRPELQPREFLQKLSKITENEPTALIFDEVITGLRIGLGGAQEHFGVKADLASYGKIVGGGMPIGVVAGKAKYLDGLDGGFWNFGDDSRPEAGMTYFAGTFVRHPITLAASKAILEHLKAGGQPMYDRLNELADYLGQQLNNVFQQLNAPLRLEHFGSLFKIQFEQELVYSEVFFSGLRRRGMHIWDHRPCLLTLAHRAEHIDAFAQAAFDTIIECQRYGFMPGNGYQDAAVDLDSPRPPQVRAQAGTDDNGKPGWFVPDAS
ncbi:MAG TPA: beta-ketoacyl synthase, partial [Planctomycetaceae bacterium]|nr:beta-ketoacyl synthase [Planctomycetaceae bacterium]